VFAVGRRARVIVHHGGAGTTERGRYRAAAVAAELRTLADPSYPLHAVKVSARVALEDGASVAADIVVDVLQRRAAEDR